MALDLMRGIEREREGAERVLGALGRSLADLPHAAAALSRVQANLRDPGRESLARRTAEMLAQLAAAAALQATAPASIAEAYAANRLGGLPGRSYGNSLPGEVVDRLLNRGLVNGG
jgi:hypothetical protein